MQTEQDRQSAQGKNRDNDASGRIPDSENPCTADMNPPEIADAPGVNVSQESANIPDSAPSQHSADTSGIAASQNAADIPNGAPSQRSSDTPNGTASQNAADAPAETADAPHIAVSRDAAANALQHCTRVCESILVTQNDWYRSIPQEDKRLILEACRTTLGNFPEWSQTYRGVTDHAPVTARTIFPEAPARFALPVTFEKILDVTRAVGDTIVECHEELAARKPTPSERETLEASLVYSRALADSAAHIYAVSLQRERERIEDDEAYVMEALATGAHDGAVLSRMMSLGWTPDMQCMAFAGSPPSRQPHDERLQTWNRQSPSVQSQGAQSPSGQLQNGRSQGAQAQDRQTQGTQSLSVQLHKALAGTGITGFAGLYEGTSAVLCCFPEGLCCFPEERAHRGRAHKTDIMHEGGASETDITQLTELVLPLFSADRPVCCSAILAGAEGASLALRDALRGLQAAAAVPECPRPLPSDEALPERALLGDSRAREKLRGIYSALKESNEKTAVLDTLSAYLFNDRSLERTAQQLSVHPNTVRYRLRRCLEETGWDPTNPRDAFVMLAAVKIGMCAS